MLADFTASILLHFGLRDRARRLAHHDDETFDTLAELSALMDSGDARRAFLARQHLGHRALWLSGLFPDGEDFDAGWKFARQLGVPIIDEHYYKPPQWFLDHTTRYDTYDRTRGHVYAGEYAAHDDHRRNTLRSALAEAAFMTGLERNGDVVRLASYAPLLAKIGRTQWNPDLIYFTNTAIFPTINYHVQRLFSLHSGDTFLPTETAGDTTGLFFSTVRDSRTGDVILKIVNPTAAARTVRLNLASRSPLPPHATLTLLAGDPLAVNDRDHPASVLPTESRIPLSPSFAQPLPPHSFAVIRLTPRG